MERAEIKGNYSNLTSRYPGIHPKLICLSCKSNFSKCCLAPLTIPLKMCYWNTCINSLNINHFLFTFVISFVTVERKQHVGCVYMCVLKFKLYLRKWKKSFSFTKQVEAQQRFIVDGIGYLGNRFEFFHQTRCSVLTYFQLLCMDLRWNFLQSLYQKVFLSTLSICVLLKCITLFPLHF